MHLTPRLFILHACGFRNRPCISLVVTCVSCSQTGMTGGSHDSYVQHMVRACRFRGLRAVVFNSRGTTDSPVTSPKFYSASYTNDLRWAVPPAPQGVSNKFSEAIWHLAGPGCFQACSHLPASICLYAYAALTQGGSEGRAVPVPLISAPRCWLVPGWCVPPFLTQLPILHR